jgi:hypothetical protein
MAATKQALRLEGIMQQSRLKLYLDSFDELGEKIKSSLSI